MTTKRKAAAMAPAVEEVGDPNDELYFTCLGGGNEVGRSCHILRYKGKTVMVSTKSLCYKCFYIAHFISLAGRWYASRVRRSFSPPFLR
jgi:hypothetical protein